MASNLLFFCSIFVSICLSNNIIHTGPGVMDFGTIQNQRDIQCNYGIESDTEFDEICEVICLPLHCRNELLHQKPHYFKNGPVEASLKIIQRMTIKCEENLSCIAKLRMNGQQFVGYDKEETASGQQILDMLHSGGLPNTHKTVNTKRGELICGATSQACVAGQYALINFHNAYVRGNARDSNIIFKNTNAHIVIEKESNQFIMNSIFTENVHKFIVDVGKKTKHSIAGNVFNFGGLDLNDGSAVFKCHGQMSCAGLLIIAHSCGGPITFDCHGEASCNFISLNIIQSEECRDKPIRKIEIHSNKNNKEIPDFLIWCVKQEKSNKKFRCTDEILDMMNWKAKKYEATRKNAQQQPEMAQATAKELGTMDKGVHVDVFYDKKTYKTAYEDKLGKLMEEYKKERPGQLKQRVHDNQAWVFETAHAKYFGGVMIEGAAKNAMLGGAIFGGVKTLVGHEYLGATVLHAFVPQAAPLIIGSLLYVSLSRWHQRLDEKRMSDFDINVRAKELKEIVNVNKGKKSDYGDWYGDEVNFDDNGNLILYDVFYVNEESEKQHLDESVESETNIYGYYPHQKVIEKEEQMKDTNEISNTLYGISALFIVIAFALSVWICTVLTSVVVTVVWTFCSVENKDNNCIEDVEYLRVVNID